MKSLPERFEKAAHEATNLDKKPSNKNLLKLYALYKQATKGDVTGKRPGFTDMVGRAKHDAWAKLSGTSQDEAKESYIQLVESLQ